MSAQSTTPAPSFVDLKARFKLFSDVFDSFGWQLLCNLRVSMPAIVQSFDAQKQTVTVQIAIRENILQNLVSTPTEIPVLVDIPIVLPRGNGHTLAVPIQQGDECLIVFGDMCIDAWWASGGLQNQDIRRRHDLSDAFAILGPWSQPRVIPNYPTDTMQLRSDDGLTMVEIDKTGTVNITGPAKVNIQSASSVVINGSGSTVIEGKDFLTHQHTGVQTGGGNTGPVF